MTTIADYAVKSARVRGLDFSYLEWGDTASPPLVLLHGLTGNAHNWDQTATHLAADSHVLAPDQRGHGDSDHAASYATQDFVDDLEALAGAWGIGRFALVGLSMGGHNAMAYAAAHPERVERLVVIDIPPRFDMCSSPNWPAIQRLSEEGHSPFATFGDVFAQFRAGNANAPEENLRYRARWSVRTLDDGRMMLKHDPKVGARWEPDDLWSRLPAITAPTLLIRGGLTQVLPRETAEKMARTIPDCQLVEVEDAGHPIHTDRPQKLGPLIAEWLGQRD